MMAQNPTITKILIAADEILHETQKMFSIKAERKRAQKKLVKLVSAIQTNTELRHSAVLDSIVLGATIINAQGYAR